jgi:hypothetical protein
MVKHFIEIDRNINKKFEAEKENCFKSIQPLLDELSLLRTIDIVEFRTSKQYNNTISAI